MNKTRAILLAVFLILGSVIHADESEPLRVCMVSGSWEYESHESLGIYKEYLEENYSASVTLLKAPKRDDLPGLEALDDCDVALFFTRRLEISGEQLERVKQYCLSGRPIVAVRTASHGFQNWLEFDKLVLGGNYQGHFGSEPTIAVTINPDAKNYPILDGVVPIQSRSSLYKTAPVAEDCTVLMTGSTPWSNGSQPLAWSRIHEGARVFYTSLGAPQDFENATFRRLLANALFWAAKQEPRRKELPPPAVRPRPQGVIRLRLRTRVETFKGSGEWDEVVTQKEFPVAETAILICDMWDKHWCRGATERCESIARKMAPVVNAARAKGVQIIHCPSETMCFYADWPQRRRLILAPPVPLPKERDLPTRTLPVTVASEGGCFDEPTCHIYRAWTRQHPIIEIGTYDGISDNGKEVYYFLNQLGIKNLLVMGVHTNMCVLGRSFGIRQMTRWGIRCVLVRDLTDTMYSPRQPPNVPHDEGTELVVEHIEKYWCPSILSSDLIEGLP
jgi:type 1 glutamine amidotransferase/nicotinamidase-related amidase